MSTKTRNIRQETVAKTQKFLNHMLTHINANKGYAGAVERRNMHNNYGQSYLVFTKALEIGYFEKTAQSHFKSKYSKFEPIHARQLLEKIYQHHNEKLKIRKESLKNAIITAPSIKKEEEKDTFHITRGNRTHAQTYELAPETFPPRNTQRDIRRANKKRTISILWGLLKFNY